MTNDKRNAAQSKVRRTSDGRLLWWCVACGRAHGGDSSRWVFNGDEEHPTFSPSFLVRSGHYIPDHTGDCWCVWNSAHPNEPSGFACIRCHTFVRNGQIQYLGDCSHEYAGKTVEMVAF